MKRIIRIMGLCALVALAATACKKDQQTTSTLKATLTQPTSDAKTGINDSLKLVWNEGDQIKVFDNNGEEYIFTTSDNGTTTATFTGTELDASTSYVAFYPKDNASIDGNTIKLGLDANQTYASNSFAADTYPMVAKSEAGNLAFTFGSDCGLLAIPVKGTGNIGSIELTGKNNENLAGQLKYTTSGNYNFFDGSSNKVTLNCGNLSLDATNATTFYFVLPAGVFDGGFTAVLKNGDTELYTLETTNNNAIAKETIKQMPVVTVEAIGVTTGDATSVGSNTATVSGSYVVPTGMSVTEVGFYLGTNATALNIIDTAAVNTPFNHTFNNLTEETTYYYQAYAKNGTIEYKGGLMSFTTSPFNPTATPLTLEAVADGTITFNNSSSKSVTYSINGGAEQTIPAGSGENIPVVAGNKVAFYGNSSNYQNSYFQCTSDCYIYGNIMSLVNSTGFPTAVTLGGAAPLANMFASNTHLINHPTKDLVLPATTLLSDMCYMAMFQGCTGLTRAPELPATTLSRMCYANMFQGCTGLTTAPVLPATTLKNDCYNSMFSGCSNLNSITCLATNISASDCTSNWLNGVAATGTFNRNESMNDWPLNSASGIPTGWTVVPPLPIDLSALPGDYEAQDGDILTGTISGNHKISIANNATVTLSDVDITSLTDGAEYAGITCSGNANIILEGTNNIVGGVFLRVESDPDPWSEDESYHIGRYPGIYIPSGYTLTIDGTGTLNASPAYANASKADHYDCYAAGIGGGYEQDCGNIVINGGTIVARGGGRYGSAGIGGATSASCGDITITGGTVTAIGGGGAAGIGSGSGAWANTGSISSSCGDILISGGTVTATGGNDYWGAGAGIGSGEGYGSTRISTCGVITIMSTVTQVTANRGIAGNPSYNNAQSIGAGGGNFSTCGTVTIENGANVIQN